MIRDSGSAVCDFEIYIEIHVIRWRMRDSALVTVICWDSNLVVITPSFAVTQACYYF